MLQKTFDGLSTYSQNESPLDTHRKQHIQQLADYCTTLKTTMNHFANFVIAGVTI